MSLRNLPAGWVRTKLGDLATEGPTNGYSPVAEAGATGALTLRLSATSQGRMILNAETTKRVHETFPPDSALWLRPGDLLVQRSNTLDLVGTAAIFDGPARTYIYPDLMMRLRFKDESTTRWTWRYLSTPAARDYIRQVAGGTSGSMPKISGEKLRSLMILLPPEAERERLTRLLDTADAIRRKRKEAIALTEDLLRSTFLEMFGDPVTNPKGWEARKFGDLLSEPSRNGLSPSTSGKFQGKVLTLSAITRGQFDASAVKDAQFSTEARAGITVDRRDFLVCRGNGNASLVGAGEFPDQDMPDTMFPDTMIASRVDSQSIRPGYLRAYWSSPALRRQIDAAARTTNGTFKINQTALAEVSVLLPPIAIQDDFDRIAENTGTLRKTAQQALTESEALFASLVDRAFRGELTSPSSKSLSPTEKQLALFE